MNRSGPREPPEKEHPIRAPAALIGLLTIAIVLPSVRPAAADEPPVSPGGRGAAPRVAVLPLAPAEAADSRYAWIPVAFEELLVWRLERAPGLTVIPARRLHLARREIQDDGAASPEWSAVAGCLGASRLIRGVVRGHSDATTVELEIAGAGDAPAAKIALGPGKFLDVLDQATIRVAEALGAPLDAAARVVVLAPPARTLTAVEELAKAVAAAYADQWDESLYHAAEAVDSDPRYRRAQGTLAVLQSRRRNVDRTAAVQRLRVLADLARENRDDRELASAEIAHGLILQAGGSLDAAYARFENALAISFEARDTYGQIEAMGRLCDLHLQRSQAAPGGAIGAEERLARTRRELAAALEWEQLVLSEWQRMGDWVGLLSSANKAGLVLEKLDEPERAAEMHRAALTAAERTGSRRQQANAWMFLGQWYAGREDWTAARDAVVKCIDLADEGSALKARMILGGIHAKLERPGDALADFQAVHDAAAKREDLPAQLACLAEIADLQRKMGETKAALRALQEAIDIAHALQSPDEPRLRARLEEWRSAEKK